MVDRVTPMRGGGAPGPAVSRGRAAAPRPGNGLGGSADRMNLGPLVMRWLDELAECSEDPVELTRRYLTPEHAQAADLVMRRMREAGMSARLDAVGNVVGRYPGRRPGARRLILGSHLDTVRNAGKYDGALGVMLPIACLKALHERGRRLDYPVDVIAFGDEEGLRFQATLIGSRAVAGDFDPGLLAMVDEDGVRLHEALRAFGLDPEAVGEAACPRNEVAAYVEVHIEQGPVLEAEGLPVGVVTSVAGATRLRVEVMGRAGHAGTVPMNLRRDALAAASEAVVAVERICLETPGAVGTVGVLRTMPGAVNVIPGVVEFTIDVRGESDAARQSALGRIGEELAAIGRRRGVLFDRVTTHETGACGCSPRLVESLGGAVAAEGFEVRELPSGAGHDAMAMAHLTDVGMLFVRCKDGISHHPAESMTEADAAAAARVLLRFLERFDPGGREPRDRGSDGRGAGGRDPARGGPAVPEPDDGEEDRARDGPHGAGSFA